MGCAGGECVNNISGRELVDVGEGVNMLYLSRHHGTETMTTAPQIRTTVIEAATRNLLSVSNIELNAILAGLRLLQANMQNSNIQDILNDSEIRITENGIDTLCDSINHKGGNALGAADLIATINSSGGVMHETDAPVVDEEWMDLGWAYINACKDLGIDPLYADPESDQ